MAVNNRTILNVPYDEKDEAKGLGAKWDHEIKRWYIESDLDINKFKRWMLDTSVVCSKKIKSPIYIVESIETCWKCNKVTNVFALAAQNLYIRDKRLDSSNYIFSYISNLDTSLKDVLGSLYKSYFLDFSKTTKSSYVMNHCMFCNAVQGDHFMHKEIGGSFNLTGRKEDSPFKAKKLPVEGSFSIEADHEKFDHFILDDKNEIKYKNNVLNESKIYNQFELKEVLEDKSNKVEKVEPKKELNLVQYWHEGLVRASFEGFGKLKSELDNIDAFTWETTKNILNTINCKKLDDIASGDPVVRHLIIFLDSVKGYSKSNIVLCIIPLEAILKDKNEVNDHILHYEWIRPENEVPIFNHRLIGEESEVEGLGLANSNNLDTMLSQFSIDAQAVKSSLDSCLEFIDRCFSCLTVKNLNFQEWIDDFEKNKQNYPILRNKKVLLRLVNGNAVSGATKNIRNCYREIVRINDCEYKDHKLFHNFTGISGSHARSSFEESKEINSWSSPDIYLGHMDSATKKNERVCYALDPSQRVALTIFKKLDEGGILAVNGPPGTGKTSFLRAVIADQWVQPLLTKGQSPLCPVILACAATNQAVTNIISSFNEIPGPSLYDDEGERNNVSVFIESRWIPFLCSYGWYQPASIRNKADEFKNYQLISWDYASKSWKFYCASSSFQLVKDDFAFLESAYLASANEYFNDKDTLEGYSSRLKGKVIDTSQKLKKLDEQMLSWRASLKKVIESEWENEFEERYYQLLTQILNWKSPNGELENIAEEIESLNAKTKILKKCYKETNELLSKSIRYRISRAFKRAKFWVDNQLDWEDVVVRLNQCGVNQELNNPDISSVLEKIKLHIEKFRENKNILLSDKKRIDTNIHEAEKQCKAWAVAKKNHGIARKYEAKLRGKLIEKLNSLSLNREHQVEQYISSISTKIGALKEPEREEQFRNLYSVIQDNLDKTLRPQLFHICARFWEAQYIITKKKSMNVSTSSIDKLRELAMLAPVFVTTSYSVPKLMRNTDRSNLSDYMYGAADFLIVDEAGQCAAEVGSCSFLFAKKALVVGDVKQLSPVWSFSLPVDKLIYKKFFSLDSHQDYEDQGALMSSGSIMKMAQHSSSYYDIDKEIKGVMLTRHYRCREPIINICNEMVYGGALKVVKAATEPKSVWDLPLGYLVVPGESTKISGGSRCNYEEAKWIARWIKEKYVSIIEHYSSNGIQKKLSECVAVLTPFKGQVRVLKSEIDKAFNQDTAERCNIADDMVIDTVHSLQGSERPIVLFSMVDTFDPKSDHFYDNNSSLINVAVSRAKEIFIVAMDQQAVDFGRKVKSSRLRKPSDYLFHYIVKNGQRMNSRRLVVIESPNKISHISNALSQGMELEVVSTCGHLTQLDSSAQWDPLIAEQPKWQTLSEREQQLYEKTATLWLDLESVYIATDPDSEGECIAWHFLNRVKDYLPRNARNKVDVRRMLFYGLTSNEIKDAYQNAQCGLNSGLVKSALFRSILDQIISKHYPHKIGKGDPNCFSSGIGRVQLAIIDVVKYSFDKDEQYYIEVRGKVEHDNEMVFVLSNSNCSQPVIFSDPLEAKKVSEQVLYSLKLKPDIKFRYGYKLEQIDDYPAINTAKILSLGYSELRIPPSRTMKALEGLYEGVIPESLSNHEEVV